ncbi:hypothetical protein AYK20_09105 [Thermoplasmatales archaeon SG8-52-1]|nr:MAG: hypothetical protein AYK20_09105 [Thermoplasmatales archaeon SG8-52-1]
MKKTLLIIGILTILISMPAMSAVQILEDQINLPESVIIPTPNPDEYDGTFIGGIGYVHKDENDSWTFDTHAYLAGVYKTGRYKRVYGNIYNLDKEQIGSMWFISNRYILIGKIKGMDEFKLPIVGFIFFNEQYFIGRIMSFVGPVPNIWGEYTPN